MIEFFRKTTISAAEDTTEGVLGDFATIFDFRSNDTVTDVNLGAHVLTVSGSVSSYYHTQLTATINVTLNRTAIDGQLSGLHVTQFPPVND